MADQPLAIIDVGSNSGRVAVVALRDGHLETLAHARAPLRLVSESGENGLAGDAFERTVQALQDFKAVARNAGAARIIAVATSAVREAVNGADFVKRLSRVTGLDIEIISGEEEARFSLLGAVYALDVRDGGILDVGGGSIEVALFKARAAGTSWTLPLGALRLSNAYLESDPPAGDEIRALVDHVAKTLTKAGVEPLSAGDALVGTGGTIRGLARIDRREQNHPIPRIHGYVLTRSRIAELLDLLATRTRAKRCLLRGLNPDRADSIVAGALAASTVMDVVGIDEIIVSGYGLREGIALDRLGADIAAPPVVRRASIDALCARFSTWDESSAKRRTRIARALHERLDSNATPEIREMLDYACLVLDIGRSVDPLTREKRAADIVTAADLSAFRHRQVALVAAIVLRGKDHGSGLKGLRRVLHDDDGVPIAHASTVLALADAIERRLDPADDGAIEFALHGRAGTIRAAVRPGWWFEGLAERVRLDFSIRLSLEPVGAA